MSRPRPLSIALAWAPAALWAGLIWQLGGDRWSVSETSQILRPLLEWLLPDLDPASRYRLMVALRKLAHPTVYGVLAALAYPAAARTLRPGRLLARAGLALAPVAALGIADEWRQSASRVRTGSAFDVLLDVSGGLAVVAIALAIDRLLARRRRDAPATPAGSTDAV